MRINLKSTSHLRGVPFIKRVFILSFRAFKFSFKFRRTTNWRDHFKPCHDSWPVMIPDRPWLLTGHDSWPVMITDRSWLLTGHDYWPVMITDRSWFLAGHDYWPVMIPDRPWFLTGHDYWPAMITDRSWFLTGHDSWPAMIHQPSWKEGHMRSHKFSTLISLQPDAVFERSTPLSCKYIGIGKPEFGTRLISFDPEFWRLLIVRFLT